MQTFPDLKLPINCKDSFRNMGNFWDAKCFKQVLYLERMPYARSSPRLTPLYDLLLRTSCKQSKHVLWGERSVPFKNLHTIITIFLLRLKNISFLLVLKSCLKGLLEFLKYFLGIKRLASKSLKQCWCLWFLLHKPKSHPGGKLLFRISQMMGQDWRKKTTLPWLK